VLIVDDDERLAASLRRSLEYAGYRVGVAVDGPAALAAVRRGQPALVVLDVLLPGIDGYGVCRALRADPAVADPMVLMLTARDRTADRVTGIPPGEETRIFARFHQADPARQDGGAGLGLSIASWIAHAHRGSIAAANNDHGGATFTTHVSSV
jgi:CheY-like chemotaxis protein